ncbi:HdaA/DnaA family protein [Pseudooceanicola sp. C21-150M6]|uniref:HdaA/DnaA family protein n=1 Tax=Pseudooceanicola sp. C21-150M6 TaxID=3434355 RepID=UPI003D7F8A3E
MQPPLPMDHPRRPGLSRSDFVTAPGNALALALIDGWRDWPSGKMLLTGPSGSGKSHLAQIWAEQSGARILAAAGLSGQDIPALAAGPVAVEDLHLLRHRADEEALFHLHNLVLAAGQPLLITGTGVVEGWPLTLPDLKSRVQGAASARLEPPDDVLLGLVLVKLFAERQLQVAPTVVTYLLKRMDRSFDGAARVVAALDAASLAERRGINVPLAREIMDKFGMPES